MSSLDWVLDRLSLVLNDVWQYAETPEVIFCFAAVVISLSLILLNPRRH